MITRRQFVGGMAATAVTAAVPRISFSQSGERKVLVLGAGLAGLAAAYELKKAGHAVTVLESLSRAGVRVLTYRDPFADGLYAEMGAEYVDAADEFDHRYCKEFGLTVMKAKLYDAIFVRGQKFRMDAFKQNKESLPFKGTIPGRLFGQEAEYTKRLRAAVSDPEKLPKEILDLDNISISDLLNQE